MEMPRSIQRDSILAKNFLTECTKGMARTVPSILVYTSGKVGKLICRNKKERSNYISKGKCGNKSKKGTIKCWNELIAIMTNIKNLKNDRNKLPSMCW